MGFKEQGKIKVAMVTPVFNRLNLTLQCLKSIARLNLENIEIHIVIVDDGSTDGTEKTIKEKYPEFELVKGDGNLFYTAGMNRGVEAALKHDPDYIFGFNNDSIFDENCLKAMVECAEKHPKSVVGALLLLWDTPHKLFQTSPKWSTKHGGWRHWQHQTIWTIPEKPWEVELIVGNCILFPAQAVRQVGMMDEKRFIQYGDAEYMPRLRRNGWRLLIEPKARVFCMPNYKPEKLRDKSKSEIIKILFTHTANEHSLYRWFYTNLEGAPNKFKGVVAFGIFLANIVRGFRPHLLPEKPLSETFADKVVE